MTDIGQMIRMLRSPDNLGRAWRFEMADTMERLCNQLDEADATIDAFGKVTPQQYEKEIAALKETIQRSSERIVDAERTIFKLNSDEELQSLMKLNNELLARANAAEAQVEEYGERLNCVEDTLGSVLGFLEGDPGYANSKPGLIEEIEGYFDNRRRLRDEAAIRAPVSGSTEVGNG